MAIAHDVSTNVGTAYTSVGTQNTSHAAASGARAAVVLIEQDGSTTDQVSGVTYNGVTMERLGSSTDDTEAGRVYIYFLDNISGGTQTVAMTTSGTTAKYISVSTMTVAAGKVSHTGYSTSGSVASGSNPALTLPSVNGKTYVAYEVIHSGLQTMTSTPQTTPAWTAINSTFDLGTTGYGMARLPAYVATGSTITAGWIAATADDYVISGVALYEDLTQTILPSGLLSQEAFGSSVLSATITTSPTGIATEESIPNTHFVNNLSSLAPTSILTGEAFGLPSISATITVSPPSIAPLGVFGTPYINAIWNLSQAGNISSAATIPNPILSTTITASPPSIASGFVSGSHVLGGSVTLSPPSITPSETFGSTQINATITVSPTGINDSPIGIVGTPTVLVGAVTLNITGIASQEVFGSSSLAIVEETWGFFQIV
jgi:hypothetical protein